MRVTGSHKKMIIATRMQRKSCRGRKIKRRTKRRSQERQQCRIRPRPPPTMDAAILESLEVKADHEKRRRMRAIQAKDGACVSE